MHSRRRAYTYPNAARAWRHACAHAGMCISYCGGCVGGRSHCARKAAGGLHHRCPAGSRAYRYAFAYAAICISDWPRACHFAYGPSFDICVSECSPRWLRRWRRTARRWRGCSFGWAATRRRSRRGCGPPPPSCAREPRPPRRRLPWRVTPCLCGFCHIREAVFFFLGYTVAARGIGLYYIRLD